MKPAFLIVVLLMAFALDCSGQGFGPPGADDPQAMGIRTYFFPDGFPGTKKSDKLTYDGALSGREDPRDFAAITRFFKSKGIAFPPGSQAIYMDYLGLLIVRSTDKVRSAISAYQQEQGYFNTALDSLTLEITAVECTLPAAANPLLPRQVTYAELEKLPAGSVRLLDHALGATTLGQNMMTDHLFNPNPAVAGDHHNAIDGAGDFAPGESGSIMTFEQVIDSNERFLAIGLTYRLRILASPQNNIHAIDVYLRTSFVSGVGSPMVLDVMPAPEGGDKFIVIIGCANVVHPWKGSRVLMGRVGPNFDYSTAINALPSP